jgi:hypothetical protein
MYGSFDDHLDDFDNMMSPACRDGWQMILIGARFVNRVAVLYQKSDTNGFCGCGNCPTPEWRNYAEMRDRLRAGTVITKPGNCEPVA